MQRIDAHQHFWRLARGDYHWLTPDLGPVYRDFGPADLTPLLARAGIGHSVLVQAAPTQAETAFLLSTARATGFVAGVVGWVDLAAVDAPARIASLAEDEYLCGVRAMVHDIPDPEWVLGAALEPALRALAELGLALDLLVRPEHLPGVRLLVRRHPDLQVVIDHAAKPDLARWNRARGRFRAWADAMADLARSSPAACKLSGLVTEAAPGWRADDLRPYVDHLLACFGPERLIWGSDWPLVNLAGGYAAWWTATGACLAALGADDRAKVLGGNALRYYRL